MFILNSALDGDPATRHIGSSSRIHRVKSRSWMRILFLALFRSRALNGVALPTVRCNPIDGTYVHIPPIRLLLGGNFHQDVHIMQGHNSNEVIYPALSSPSAVISPFMVYQHNLCILRLSETLPPC